MAHAHSHSHSHSHTDSHAEQGHVVPVSTFFKVLVALLILTVITVLAAKVDLGKWNIVGALVIASIKASLVILIFMHGKYENKILWVYILIPFVLLAIMIGGIFTDDPFRDRITHFKVEQKK
ncbi:MAG: cytochrome C oxidase subunit IV family protein [Pseudomonadota bacterium]|jgi:cytochrome c oxidase subunit 4